MATRPTLTCLRKETFLLTWTITYSIYVVPPRRHPATKASKWRTLISLWLIAQSALQSCKSLKRWPSVNSVRFSAAWVACTSHSRSRRKRWPPRKRFRRGSQERYAWFVSGSYIWTSRPRKLSTTSRSVKLNWRAWKVKSESSKSAEQMSWRRWMQRKRRKRRFGRRLTKRWRDKKQK